MKTLVNKANPQIRISAPDGMVKNRTNCWAIWNRDTRILLLAKDDWTLVEEEPEQKEQKPDELTPEEKMNHPLWLEGFDVGRDVQKVFDEQKPVEWSEEDEKMRNALLNLLHLHYAQDNAQTLVGIEAGKFRSWLKSLRPQPKNELSEKQQMPDSTQLIAEWEKEKAVLEQKDFRGDAERMAYNAFLDGFVKGLGYEIH